MLKWLHGLIEGFALRVYRGGARELKAKSATWEQIEILSDPAMLPRLLEALDFVLSNAPRSSEIIRQSLKTVICANGIMTKTLPVTRVFLIDARELEAAEKESLAYMLVQSAAYCAFYANRTIFIPTLFFRKRDKQAREEAKQFSVAFRNEMDLRKRF